MCEGVNVLFNIYGKRYDIPSYNNIINLDHQAKHECDIKNIKGGRIIKSEALLAYF
jgi:hypothetical protein